MSANKKMNTTRSISIVLFVFTYIIGAFIGLGHLLNLFIKKDYQINN